MKNKYRSDLSKAKNLGASGSASHHWLHQRVTAIIIGLMVFWVFYFASKICANGTSGIISSIQNPINAIMLMVFSIMIMYHGVLGMQVVIEDYVHCRIAKLILLLTTQIFAIFTTISFIVAVLYVMML